MSDQTPDELADEAEAQAEAAAFDAMCEAAEKWEAEMRERIAGAAFEDMLRGGDYYSDYPF